VTVSGPFNQGAGGTLNLKLGGPASGCTTSDTLSISGAATLAGGLNVTAVGCSLAGNPPNVTILTFATRNGTTFDRPNIPQPYSPAPFYNDTSNPPSIQLTLG
jgi:hypothetical protein